VVSVFDLFKVDMADQRRDAGHERACRGEADASWTG